MSVSITIGNTGSTTVHGWRLTFAFPDPGQHITTGWSAQWSQSGTAVTAVPFAWNSDLPPGQHVTIGFNGTNSGTDPEPPIFYLNGVPCD
jgi:cellulase/cellobiase CelA1